jgi:hypothetical protein
MGWMKDLVSILQGETKAPSTKLLYGGVEAKDWVHDAAPAKPGTAYMQLFLQEMWLTTERSWVDHYAPVAYSVVKLSFGDQTIEIPASLGDFEFAEGEDFKNLQDALRLNYPMTPPLPYNGGVVEVSAALVRLKTSSGLKEIVSAMDQLSRVLAVPQLSAVVSVAGPVANALDSVLGQTKERLALGLHQSFKYNSQEQLSSGYYLAAHYDGDDRNLLKKLIVQDGALRWQRGGERVRDFDYMLFRLEMQPQRDDVEYLTSIFGWMKKAQEAAIGDRLEEARGFVQQACLAAWSSPDLTIADRKRLPIALRANFDEFLNATGIIGSGASVDSAPIKLSELISRIAPEDALARPDEEVLRGILVP